jgi:hypothetical protein
MGELHLTSKLKGDFGELIFKHFSEKNKYAYISLEEIYNTLTPKNILIFSFGYHRIPVKIPDEIVEEIRNISKPSNRKEHEPSFQLDFLTVSLRCSFNYSDGKYVQLPYLTPRAFNWVEIKTGKGKLTRNQKSLIGNTEIPLSIFRVNTEMPPKMEVNYDE